MDVLAGLKELFCFWHPPKPPIPFVVLFKKFKSILERNNRILELMADMGDKLSGDYIFDRQYINDACERVSDLVFKLVSDLNILTESEDVELFIAFERIQHEIHEELAGRRAVPVIRPTILLDELNSDLSEEVGNKFANLGDIRNTLGLSTPDGFVITTKAFFDFMEFNGLGKYIDKALSCWDGKAQDHLEAVCKDIRKRILQATMPKNLLAQVNAMADILGSRHHTKSLRLAVRSSAWAEDNEHSFAGQYESILGVPRSGILDAYRQVLASVYTPEAWQYRLHRGYKEHEIAMAVGCQVMVDAQVSGAMYTYAPLPLEKEAMVISAAWGLGPAVVQGIAESDTFVLDRCPPHQLLSLEIGQKERRLAQGARSGTIWKEVEEPLHGAPCLSADQLQRLAHAALAIERYYKRPQDIEWTFDGQSHLYILQSRPLNIRPEHREARSHIDDATLRAQVAFSNKGTVVQGGVGSGKVFLACGDEDLKDFPYGAILVALHTSPRYARIMQKAHGIITDVGSATGHMATLAREYRVPTVVDTGIATKMLRQGDEITLDASENVVYLGTIRELSRFELTEQDVFEESYEYRLLRRLLKKISPLNLIDSHSDDFKPSRCRTYHDITRYSHEKAVEKLIDLSENYQRYHDKVPKRLEVDLPLGLMVIDIEDGTSASQDSRAVTMDQIRSVPLKALLKGLTESGMWTTDPVAVDIGSFMSSVTRTCSTSMAGYGRLSRNLAVASKEYMNLNLRLGYHFNLVDAYIGDVPNDNYVSFRFLGGVTDFIRRSRRAKFIAAVLEQLDFRVEVHGDLVVGRLKKNSTARMCSKIMILGGLIGYTRQLDVGMKSDDQMARSFADFMQRIQPIMDWPAGSDEQGARSV